MISSARPSPLELAVFRLLLFAYPRDFRMRYRSDLLAFFRRDRQRRRYAGWVGGWRFWRHTLSDLIAAAARQRRVSRLWDWKQKDSRLGDWSLGEPLRDLGFAVRQLRNDPTFTLVAVLTLAVAIGANTAVFSVVNGVLLRPLPYPESARLARILTRFLPESGFDIDRFPPSVAEAVAYGNESAAMQQVAIYVNDGVSLTAPNQDPVRLAAVAVDDRVLPLLGVPAEVGRWFPPEEAAPGAAATAILGYDLWAARYGRDPSLVGQTITLDGTPTQVVGVMPAGFDFPSRASRIYLPLQFDRSDPGGWSEHGVDAVARLADGYSLQQAEAELESLNQSWREQFGHPQIGHSLYLVGLHRDTVGEVRQALWLLMAAVALILAIGATNVANLMLARGEARGREVWLRMALGAGKVRIIRQLLTESLLLASLGGVLGVVLAYAGLEVALRIDPEALPRADGIEISLTVLAFAAAAALGTALLFGLAPALQAGTAVDAGNVRSTSSASRKRARDVLVAVEVAMSVVVVLSAALVGRSFAELSRVEPGFAQGQRLTFGLSLPSTSYPTTSEVRSAINSLVDRLEAVPGVVSVAYTSSLPFSGDQALPSFRIQGRARPQEGERALSAQAIVVTPGYVPTMGIKLVEGRAFAALDDETGPAVALVNREAARIHWPGESAVGQLIAFGPDDSPWTRIVGVVEDVRTEGLSERVGPQVYLAFAQRQGFWGATSPTGAFVLRAAVEPESLTTAARGAVASLDPRLPLTNIRTVEDVVGRSVAGPRLTASLLGSFAAIALLLAMVGVYGIVSYAVSRRTREIGIRQALGARPGWVLGLMLRQGVTPALVGLAVGLLVSFFLTSLISGLLFQVSPQDPATFIVLPLLLAAVAVLASYLPARRATRVPPVVVLRAE